jgi:hypothetical protein
MVVHHTKEDCQQKDTLEKHDNRLTITERFMWTAGGAVGVLLVVIIPIFKQALTLMLDMRQDRQEMVQIVRGASRYESTHSETLGGTTRDRDIGN